MTAAHVTALSITPVKGTRLRQVDGLRLEQHGVRENRRFFLIDERDRMVNAKQLGELQTIVARYHDAERRLELEFPDGRVVAGRPQLGDVIEVRFFSRQVRARPVLGKWSRAISAHVGRPLRLVEAGQTGAVDRGARGAVSLISRASLDRLASEGALDGLDARRFRMMIEIDGVAAHAEDDWIGRQVVVGEAVIRPLGHVGRCLITSRDPDNGMIDVPTLDILRGYRSASDTTEPLPLGVYGEVVKPGVVAVGNRVELRRLEPRRP
jgi:uncharacterized protein YcbX